MFRETTVEDHLPRPSERGVALVMAIIFTVIVVGITVSGSLIMKSNRTRIETNFVQHGQAAQFAKSGLIEALGWFRKQTSQPVLAINPIQDLIAVPPVIETDDPDIGIAREWKVTGAIWGRYEVWKEWDTDPIPERLAWRQQMESEDVSDQRGGIGAGSVWRVRSIGYVFQQVNPAVPFDQPPNRVLGQEILETEIRRLLLQPPSQAAISIETGGNATVGNKGRVLGGATAAGLFYTQGSGAPTISGGAEVSGTPSQSTSATYNGSLEDVFGVTEELLRTVADQTITVGLDFPNPVPTNSLIVTDVPLIVFNSTRPLRGTGVLYFKGDVLIDAGSASSFSGLIYVDGNLTMLAPSEILGAVIVTGNLNVTGATDFSTVAYDDDVLNALRLEVGQYRLSSAFQRPLARDR